MNLVDTLKGIDFDKWRKHHESMEEDWGNFSISKAETVALFFDETLHELLKCAVNEGYISQDTLDGTKTFNVRQTFAFDFDIEATSMEEALKKLSHINDDASTPTMRVEVDGYTLDVEGDYVDETIEQERFR